MPRAFWSGLFNRRRPSHRPARPAYRPRLDALEERSLLSAGALDPAFGAGGKVLLSFNDSLQESPTAVLRQPDGKLLVTGASGVAAVTDLSLNPVSFAANDPRNPDGSLAFVTDFSVARYNSDGSLDQTFGTGGKVVTVVGTDYDDAYAVAIQPDGKIVAAGNAGFGSFLDFGLVRYEGNSDFCGAP